MLLALDSVKKTNETTIIYLTSQDIINNLNARIKSNQDIDYAELYKECKKIYNKCNKQKVKLKHINRTDPRMRIAIELSEYVILKKYIQLET